MDFNSEELKRDLNEKQEQWKRQVKADYSIFLQQDRTRETQLLHYTGLHPRESQKVLRGETISVEVATYAILFYHCGIPSADPRLLPERYNTVPNVGPRPEKRAWSDKEYDLWVSTQNAPFYKTYSSSTVQVLSSDRINDSMQLLIKAFSQVIGNSTVEERDVFVSKYGDTIRLLNDLSDVLSAPKDSRERIIRLRLDGNGSFTLTD